MTISTKTNLCNQWFRPHNITDFAQFWRSALWMDFSGRNTKDLTTFDLLIYWFITFYWAGFYSCPEGKGTRGLQGPIQRCPTSPTPHSHTKDSHSTGITLLFSNSARVLLRPTELSTFKELWDGTSDLSSLSEKTRMSNHLQMKLQGQHFLLSYLKTLSVGPVGVSNSRPPVSQPGAQPSEPPVRGNSHFSKCESISKS